MKISGPVGVAFIQLCAKLFSFTKLKIIYKQNLGTAGLEAKFSNKVYRCSEYVALRGLSREALCGNYELTQSRLLSMEADDILKSFRYDFSLHFDGCTIVKMSFDAPTLQAQAAIE